MGGLAHVGDGLAHVVGGLAHVVGGLAHVSGRISSCVVSQLHMLIAQHPWFDSRRQHNCQDWWLSPVTLLLGDKDMGWSW